MLRSEGLLTQMSHLLAQSAGSFSSEPHMISRYDAECMQPIRSGGRCTPWKPRHCWPHPIARSSPQQHRHQLVSLPCRARWVAHTALLALEHASFACPANELHLAAIRIPAFLTAHSPASFNQQNLQQQQQQQEPLTAWLLSLVQHLVHADSAGAHQQSLGSRDQGSQPQQDSQTQQPLSTSGLSLQPLLPAGSPSGRALRLRANHDTGRGAAASLNRETVSKHATLPTAGSLKRQILHSALSVLMNVTHNSATICSQVWTWCPSTRPLSELWYQWQLNIPPAAWPCEGNVPGCQSYVLIRTNAGLAVAYHRLQAP